MKELIDPPAIHGEAVPGAESKLRSQIEAIVEGLNSNTFDLADYLLKADVTNCFSKWGFNSAGEFFESIKLKKAKGHYLLKIAKTMSICNIERSIYEPIGVAKLRVITKIDPLADYSGAAGADIIKALIEELSGTPEETSIEALKESIDKLLGKTGDDTECWLNVSMTRAARDKVVKPALKSVKMSVGSVSTDADGNKVDCSDGRALELMAANWLSENPVDEA